MKWRMTYNNVNGAACSARGIAHRNSKEELVVLAKALEDKIDNIKIEKYRGVGTVTSKKYDKKVD